MRVKTTTIHRRQINVDSINRFWESFPRVCDNYSCFEIIHACNIETCNSETIRKCSTWNICKMQVAHSSQVRNSQDDPGKTLSRIYFSLPINYNCIL